MCYPNAGLISLSKAVLHDFIVGALWTWVLALWRLKSCFASTKCSFAQAPIYLLTLDFLVLSYFVTILDIFFHLFFVGVVVEVVKLCQRIGLVREWTPLSIWHLLWWSKIQRARPLEISPHSDDPLDPSQTRNFHHRSVFLGYFQDNFHFRQIVISYQLFDQFLLLLIMLTAFLHYDIAPLRPSRAIAVTKISLARALSYFLIYLGGIQWWSYS